MTNGRIHISPRAIALFRQLALVSHQKSPAFHIVYVLDEKGPGRWSVGLTPEAEILAGDTNVKLQIVAGRYDGILVVVDGPSNGLASTRRIRIGSLNGRTFTVSVT